MSWTPSTQLLSFIARYVDSVELVEVLLYLRERAPEALDIEKINEAIRSDPASIRGRLEMLVAAGVAQRGSEPHFYTFSPHPSHEQPISQLAAAYKDRRTKVIELIYSRPARDVYHFSNAFVIRKKGGDDDR